MNLFGNNNIRWKGSSYKYDLVLYSLKSLYFSHILLSFPNRIEDTDYFNIYGKRSQNSFENQPNIIKFSEKFTMISYQRLLAIFNETGLKSQRSNNNDEARIGRGWKYLHMLRTHKLSDIFCHSLALDCFLEDKIGDFINSSALLHWNILCR